jgi:hypothetical protein
MLNPILRYGLIAGLIAGGVLSLTVAAFQENMPSGWGMAIGYTTMLIAFSTIFVAIKKRRDEGGGGVIRFWPAFGLGAGITLVASIIYSLCWEATLAATGVDFIGAYTRGLIAQKQAAGASAQEIARFTAEMAEMSASYANPLYRLPMTMTEIFPVGILVSLIAAALLRNPRFMPLRRDAARV